MREFSEEIIDIGDTVICDFCNADYTDRDDPGGVLLGTYAVCPQCAADLKAGTEIDGRCPNGMSFRDWVLQLRGGDNTIRIMTW